MNSGRKIISFSGGKDSTAMLIIMLEQGIPFDEIVYFDAGAWEFPAMAQHLDKVEERLGVHITRLKPALSFDFLFSDYVLTKGKRIGQRGYGFPKIRARWCARTKVRCINKYLGEHEAAYIGYAYDEQHRVKKQETKAKNVYYPLIVNKITEAKALKICYDYGFDWSGLYEIFNRVSCWCCPFQRISELEKLYKHFPELWRRLEEMQTRSCNNFRMNNKPVQVFSELFKNKNL